MNLRCTCLLLLGLLAVTAGSAQPRDRKDDRRDDRDQDRYRGARVILYQHADYKGNALVLYPGEAIEDLAGVSFEGGGGSNDQISSLRVEGAAEVYVYENARYRGAVMRLVENTRNLTGRLMPGSVSASWNDRISSLRVEIRRRDAADEAHADPDAIIKQAYQDLLAREPDPAGLRNYRGMIIDQGWTERMMRDDLRQGVEFRREGADRIIRRAYRDVLGREPDPSGQKHFRELLLEKNWTEGDVRDDLRRSEEFRNKNREKNQADPRR